MFTVRVSGMPQSPCGHQPFATVAEHETIALYTLSELNTI